MSPSAETCLVRKTSTRPPGRARDDHTGGKGRRANRSAPGNRRSEESGEIVEGAILPRAAAAIDHQHARRSAIGERGLRDQFLGQMVIEIGKKHLSLK